ncbi:hypothetical protein TELCIR_11572, partial [Teladorsagia circumcincta]
VEQQIEVCIRDKVDAFIELAQYDWELPASSGALIFFFGLGFSTCKHLSSRLSDVLLSPDVKAISMGALEQFSLDILMSQSLSARISEKLRLFHGGVLEWKWRSRGGGGGYKMVITILQCPERTDLLMFCVRIASHHRIPLPSSQDQPILSGRRPRPAPGGAAGRLRAVSSAPTIAGRRMSISRSLVSSPLYSIPEELANHEHDVGAVVGSIDRLSMAPLNVDTEH